MAETSRSLAKKAGASAIETTLRAVMPRLEESIADLAHELRSFRQEVHDELRVLDVKVDSLRDEMLSKFEAHRELVNEVSHRITRLDGNLEGFTDAMGLKLMEGERGPKRRRVG